MSRYLLGQVAEAALAVLAAGLAGGAALADVGGHGGAAGEPLVEAAGDRGIDIEARHVEQRHRSHDGELVADAPGDAGIEILGFDDALLYEIEAFAHHGIEHAILDEPRDVLTNDDGQMPAAADQLPHP